jgi:hypothetical protein
MEKRMHLFTRHRMALIKVIMEVENNGPVCMHASSAPAGAPVCLFNKCFNQVRTNRLAARMVDCSISRRTRYLRVGRNSPDMPLSRKTELGRTTLCSLVYSSSSCWHCYPVRLCLKGVAQ